MTNQAAKALASALPDFAPAEVGTVPLSASQFARITELLHRLTGIDLKSGKEQLVKARLWKRIRAQGMQGYDEYLGLLEGSDGADELIRMVESLTTHETYFFRESKHYEYLSRRLHGWFSTHDSLRIWSAGCSTGEEPYSIAMVLSETMPDAHRRNIKILATDISGRVVHAAREGHYSEKDVSDVPRALLQRYFVVDPADPSEPYRMKDSLASMVTFAKLNLMGPWPMQGPFHFIFCRNVMIYFDHTTQAELVARLAGLLAPGGALLVGHSESLRGGIAGLQFVLPAVYERPTGC